MADDADAAPEPWVPLSVREEPDQLEEFMAVREGVPIGAQRSLVDWCASIYSGEGRETRNDLLELFETAANRRLPNRVFNFTDGWAGELTEDDALLLDAIHFSLLWATETDRSVLSGILRTGRSVYRVGQGEDDRWELQRTYSDEMIALVEATAGQTGRAAEHLRIAWSKIAGRHPDPDKACWDAAKAVEVAAKPFVSPNDSGLTLGRIIGEMGKHPERWECELTPVGSVERIVDMMSVVWEEGRRHGDETKPIGVSPEAAEIVVQTAVVLAHWFESGFVRRVST